MAKPLSLLTSHKAMFEWTPIHHRAFMMLKEAIIQAPILCYPDPARGYIVYPDFSDDACEAQLSQEHDGAEFLIAFLSHIFTETQRKWSTPEQEAYRVYYAIPKWNFYLQGADIIVHNDHKPLAKFLNGKNAYINVNRWGLNMQNITPTRNNHKHRTLQYSTQQGKCYTRPNHNTNHSGCYTKILNGQ